MIKKYLCKKIRHEMQYYYIFTNFSIADDMPDPICFLGKDWDNIKIDLIKQAENMSLQNPIL